MISPNAYRGPATLEAVANHICWVNEEFAHADVALADGDEVAIMPPVRDAPMTVVLKLRVILGRRRLEFRIEANQRLLLKLGLIPFLRRGA